MTTTLEISGPCGPLETELRTPRGEARGSAVVCHPHPLYGGTMRNAVVEVAERKWLARGLVTARFNFRGVGHSAGEHDGGKGEQDDLRAVLTALEERTGSTPWMAGYSFGAAVALSLLQGPGARLPGLVAIAPPLEHYDFSFLQQSEVPIAIVHGEDDDLTPAEALEEARGSWSSLRAVECVQGAGHDLGTASGSTRALEQALDRALDHLSL